MQEMHQGKQNVLEGMQCKSDIDNRYSYITVYRICDVRFLAPHSTERINGRQKNDYACYEMVINVQGMAAG